MRHSLGEKNGFSEGTLINKYEGPRLGLASGGTSIDSPG
jgi:hypothetical protein